MPKTWSFRARVEAPPDAVYAWMSDHQPDDHGNADFQRGARTSEKDRAKRSHRVVERKDARHLVVKDEWGRQTFEMEVELAPEAREVRLRGQFGYRGVWKATPDGSGTVVTSEGRLEPTGFAKLFAPLFAGAFMKQMQADFDGHLEDMQTDLKAR